MISIRKTLAALAVIAASAPAHANVTISSAATQNMSCINGTCEPTARSAVLNVTDLQNDLSTFGNVRVMTTGNGVEANNIVVKAAFSSPDSTSLTLEAHNAITVDAAVSIGSGTAELELQSDTYATHTLYFGRKGSISFGSLSDIFGINGGIFTLVGSIQGLAVAVAANPSGAFALANSYDASADGAYSESPIVTTFTGQFDGLGNTISHLSIHHTGSGTSIGLFYFLFTPGTLEHVRLAHVRIEGTRTGRDGDIIGALVGVTTGGYLFQDSATGTIQLFGRGVVGGLVGEEGSSAAEIDTCFTDVTIDAVKANGRSNAGGLVGFGETILDSFTLGSVLVGNNSYAGGLVGSEGSVENSYSIGTVSGGVGARIGGLIGNADQYTPIDSAYSTGAVSGAAPSYVGGFAGVSYSRDTTKSYWDTTTSGTTQAVGKGKGKGITGLTTEQLQSGLPDGFDPSIWAEDANINNGLPYLINSPPP